MLLCDVLFESHNILFDYEEVINDPQEYIKLNDGIIYEIEVSKDPRLKKA